MTKIAIYNPGDADTTTYLRLIQSEDDILLQAVDSRGRLLGPGNLIRIYADGTFLRQAYSELNGKPFRDRRNPR